MLRGGSFSQVGKSQGSWDPAQRRPHLQPQQPLLPLLPRPLSKQPLLLRHPLHTPTLNRTLRVRPLQRCLAQKLCSRPTTGPLFVKMARMASCYPNRALAALAVAEVPLNCMGMAVQQLQQPQQLQRYGERQWRISPIKASLA